MKTAILSILTAGALAIAPISTKPAHAADTGDILGGIVGLAILGALANELNDRNETSTAQTRTYRPYNNGVYNNGYYNGNGLKRGHNKRRHNNVLPGECLRVIEGRNRDRIVFPARCLQREGIATRNLPDRCIRRIEARRNGPMNVYGARCLADRGWRLPRIATR